MACTILVTAALPNLSNGLSALEAEAAKDGPAPSADGATTGGAGAGGGLKAFVRALGFLQCTLWYSPIIFALVGNSLV